MREGLTSRARRSRERLRDRQPLLCVVAIGGDVERRAGASLRDERAEVLRGAGDPLRRISRPRSPIFPAAERIENHLVKAILATLFCCLPLGIVAIVYAAQVDSRAREGDIDGALRLSREANKWGNWSIGLGIGVGVIYVLFLIIGAAAGS